MKQIIEAIRAAIPNAPEDLADYILWNRTPYPFGKITARSLYKAASRFERAGRSGKGLCEFCDNLAPEGEYACDRCKKALQKAREWEG